MKNVLKTVAVVALTIGAYTSINAQKIAHIKLDSLITLMPESKTAQEIAQSYLKDLEKQVTTMETELQTKYNDYLQNQTSMTELVRKTKEEELQSLNKRIEDFKVQAQQDYQKKYGELSKPIYEKANKAIESVAKENGYKYVLDTSVGSVLYSEPADDVLALVKKKLDTMPLANLPGGANNTTKPVGTGGVKSAPGKGGK